MYTFGHLLASITVIAAAVWAYIHADTLKEAFGEGIKLAMTDYIHGGDVQREFDALQINCKCCGADNYDDWFTTPWTGENILGINNSV